MIILRNTSFFLARRVARFLDKKISHSCPRQFSLAAHARAAPGPCSMSRRRAHSCWRAAPSQTSSTRRYRCTVLQMLTRPEENLRRRGLQLWLTALNPEAYEVVELLPPTASGRRMDPQRRRFPLLTRPRAFVSGQRTGIVLHRDGRSLFDRFPEVASNGGHGDPGGPKIVSPLEFGKRCLNL